MKIIYILSPITVAIYFISNCFCQRAKIHSSFPSENIRNRDKSILFLLCFLYLKTVKSSSIQFYLALYLDFKAYKLIL